MISHNLHWSYNEEKQKNSFNLGPFAQLFNEQHFPGAHADVNEEIQFTQFHFIYARHTIFIFDTSNDCCALSHHSPPLPHTSAFFILLSFLSSKRGSSKQCTHKTQRAGDNGQPWGIPLIAQSYSFHLLTQLHHKCMCTSRTSHLGKGTLVPQT